MSDSPRFSIQKYEDVDLHYIFRLQLDGEVISWTVPRGPSPDPRVKRLAIPSNPDIDIDFEGVMEGDGKSRGKVIVWDSGPYKTYNLDNAPMSVAEGLESGQIGIWLEGEKLQGGFSLLRIEEGANERWLLMKMIDEKATSMRNPVVTEPLSVVSGRALEDVDE